MVALQFGQTGVGAKRYPGQIPQAYPSVVIRHQGRKVGLYRVRRVETGRLVLSHGGISFPVGTRLLIEDYQGLIHGAPTGSLPARVVANDMNGLSLAW